MRVHAVKNTVVLLPALAKPICIIQSGLEIFTHLASTRTVTAPSTPQQDENTPS